MALAHDQIGVNFLLDDHFADNTSVHCSTNRGFLLTEKKKTCWGAI